MNFLGAGPGEIILIAVIAMIVFGPGKLPEIMGQVGRMIRDFQRISAQLNAEFTQSLQTELAEAKAVVEETKTTLVEARASLGETQAAFAGTVGAPQPVVAPPTANVAASAAPASMVDHVVAPDPAPTILPPERANGGVHPVDGSGAGRADGELLPPY